MHYEMKNDPRVDFGIFLFKLMEKVQNDTCSYILVVKTDVYIRGNHFFKSHEMDVTSINNSTFDAWLKDYDNNITEYLDAINQEHFIDLNKVN